LYFNTLKEVYASKYINAAGWLLPKNTLNTIGGFDPIFYHYEEDDDYLNRVLYHGLKVGFVPAARMVHDHRDGHSALSNGQLTIRRQQYLLVRFTNLNKQESCAKYQCYQLRKIIGCFVRGRWRQIQIWWQDFSFLSRMKKRIIFSRNQNQFKQSSWL
jgi:GT2 family glycosyltransferase